MKNCIALLLCACVIASLTDARSKRSVGSLTLRISPRPIVENATEEFRIECRPAPNVKNILMAVLIHLDKTDANGTKRLVARKRANTLTIFDESRTTAEGHVEGNMPAGQTDKESFLSVIIKDPVQSDSGTYQCRFVFVDEDVLVHSIESKINVTVSAIPDTNTTFLGCDCDDIWTEIYSLKSALEERKEQPRPPPQQYDGTCQVSFSARFEARHGYQIAEKTLVFDYVISNKGDAYDATTGIFKAPCDGQYFFTVNLRTHQTRDSGYVEGIIVVNDEPKARTSVYLQDPVDNYQSASNGVVLSLRQGQQVKVVVKTTSSGEFVGEDYSVFSGFFLFP